MSIPKRKNRKPVRNLKRLVGIEDNAITEALRSGEVMIRDVSFSKPKIKTL
jgi:hypothetical protein